ncbi:MAG: hypothetical protein C0404_04370 [Verrucomicrobia bacterium]|nr:hypothetical protein [Verrucomicrobiota bacterium]
MEKDRTTPSTPGSWPAAWAWMVAAFAATAIGLALRFALVSCQGLWLDEVFSLALATGHSLEHPASAADPSEGDFVETPTPETAAQLARYTSHESPPASLGRVVRAVKHSDTNPPLYYILLSIWTRFCGTSDLALRGFSVFMWMLCLPLVWALGRQMGGRRPALIALALFCLSPCAIYFSTEGRMYSLLWFFCLSAAVLTLDISDKGWSVVRGATWAIVCAGGLLTHYFFFLIWFVFGWWILADIRGKIGIQGLLAILLVGLFMLPWALIVPDTLNQWRISDGWLAGRPAWLSLLASPFYLGWSTLTARGPWSDPNWVHGGWSEIVLGAGLLAPAGAFLLGIKNRVLGRLHWLLFFWCLAACVQPALFDLVRNTQTSLVPRYVLPGLPAIVLLLAWAMSRLNTSLLMGCATLILAGWLLGGGQLYERAGRMDNPMRMAAADLDRFSERGDLVLIHSIPSGVLGMARYLDPRTRMASWVSQLNVRKLPDDLVRLSRGHSRVVLVTINPFGGPTPEKEWLTRNSKLNTQHRWLSIDAYVFAWPAATTNTLPRGE